jgi:hypothetical protein
MPEPRKDTNRLMFDEPASYQICILGVLEERWADRLGGMAVTASAGPDGVPMTVLTGELADQVALSSVLQGLHRLGCTLISVQKVDCKM